MNSVQSSLNTNQSANSLNSMSQETNSLLSTLGDRVSQALIEKSAPAAGQAMNPLEEVSPQQVAQFFNTPGQQCNAVV